MRQFRAKRHRHLSTSKAGPSACLRYAEPITIKSGDGELENTKIRIFHVLARRVQLEPLMDSAYVLQYPWYWGRYGPSDAPATGATAMNISRPQLPLKIGALIETCRALWPMVRFGQHPKYSLRGWLGAGGAETWDPQSITGNERGRRFYRTREEAVGKQGGSRGSAATSLPEVILVSSPPDFLGRRLSISTGALPHYIHSTTHHPLLLIYHWLRGALQRLVPVGAPVPHALGALTGVVGIGDGGDVSEPLATGGALESGFVAGGARDWRRTGYDFFSTWDLTYLVSAQLGGATCARGPAGSNAGIIGACRLPGLLFGPTRCQRDLAALPALGLWDLTPGPSAHVGCSGSSLGSDPLGVSATRRCYLRSGSSAQAACAPSAALSFRQSILFVPPLAPAAHSLPPPKALPELRDSATPSAYAYRHRCTHLAASGSLPHRSAAVCSTAGMFRMASPGPIAHSLPPESPASFRSTADSPMSSIHEISNEIMAPMTMTHFKSGVRLWACWCTVIDPKSALDASQRNFKSESQHRRLTSLASTGLRRSNLRPPLALFDFNSVTAFVLTATIRFKSSLKRLFDLTAWFDFKFKGLTSNELLIHLSHFRASKLQAPLDLTSNKSLTSSRSKPTPDAAAPGLTMKNHRYQSIWT
ncbi:hypothetical protein B0H15DRAFT_806747 [Mycena belliarum]|uniref:Uncharacterized protein n=1 Tax=Mycena belliarum TaxID=1033014 RepID=A0AAD6TQK8_9AGAR|nr:hypothetical protein B0H15DRAFT_806747 [Mycena belliae]